VREGRDNGILGWMEIDFDLLLDSSLYRTTLALEVKASYMTMTVAN